LRLKIFFLLLLQLWCLHQRLNILLLLAAAAAGFTAAAAARAGSELQRVLRLRLAYLTPLRLVAAAARLRLGLPARFLP
jgi:hypothetical protein